MGKNAIVGQSGGPTSVINASLAGVFESCKNRGAEIVYGMCNGVAGLLEERVVDGKMHVCNEYMFFCHTLEMTKPDNCTELWKITMLLCRLYPTYTTNSIKLQKSVPP